ncbi:putative phospholipase B-like 2 [Aphelenchoides besseyi]|nr:putative phospholipase B-like 2 [Aphelenchoides besseyi]KAI6201894.1 putative phospholipase B-like 2 [Aphelenchoides besseyi]
MLAPSVACILVAIGLLCPFGAADHAYKNFHRMFDSQEDDIHNSAEVIRREKNDGYNVKSACWNKTSENIYLIKGTDCHDDPKVATGKYANRVNETGWGILEIETFNDNELTDEIQAYAAGVLEGSLSRLQIYYHFRNTIEGMCNPTAEKREYCKRLYKYLKSNLDWIQSQVVARNDDYWKMVNLSYTQVTGIYHGYQNNKTLKPVVEFELTPILMLQLSGDLIDLEKVLKKPAELDDDPEPSKCSGFLKITEGNQDLILSHVSMSGYNTMNRVAKLYKFAYDKRRVPGHTYSFSSYAGVIASADDYTLISSGMASIETTIGIFNDTLYTDKFVKSVGQLQCWVRSTISNQLARTAKEWTDIFARYNSGTYNNQWTVVDYKLFKPGQELPNNDVVWVLEQVPGYCESRDITWFLRKYSYWPSYNIPYTNVISEISGFDRKANENNWWRWGYSPRARIFARDHKNVKDIASLRKLMRSNNYQHDEFSRCQCNPPYTAEAAISTRGDLNPVNGTWEIPGQGHRNHGSLDYKGANYEMYKKLQIEFIGGPTYNSQVPPFNWETTDIVAPHYGQPTLWKFDPFVVEWETKVAVDLNPIRSNYDLQDETSSSSSSEEEQENRVLKNSKLSYDF